MKSNPVAVLLCALMLTGIASADPKKSPIGLVKFEYFDSTIPSSQALSYVRGELVIQNRGAERADNVRIHIRFANGAGDVVLTREDVVPSLAPNALHRTEFFVYNPVYEHVTGTAEVETDETSIQFTADLPHAPVAVGGNVPSSRNVTIQPAVPTYLRGVDTSVNAPLHGDRPPLATYPAASSSSAPPGYSSPVAGGSLPTLTPTPTSRPPGY